MVMLGRPQLGEEQSLVPERGILREVVPGLVKFTDQFRQDSLVIDRLPDPPGECVQRDRDYDLRSFTLRPSPGTGLSENVGRDG